MFFATKQEGTLKPNQNFSILQNVEESPIAKNNGINNLRYKFTILL